MEVKPPNMPVGHYNACVVFRKMTEVTGYSSTDVASCKIKSLSCDPIYDCKVNQTGISNATGAWVVTVGFSIAEPFHVVSTDDGLLYVLIGENPFERFFPDLESGLSSLDELVLAWLNSTST